MTPRSPLRSIALLGAATALFAATQAEAHASLVKSNPAANATVEAPTTITVTFNEKLTPAFSKVELGMADGMKITVKTTVSKDHRTLVGAPQGKLAPGAYVITWHAAAADDGHKTNGTVAFTVK